MKIHSSLKTALTATLALALCGCASIVSHSTWPVTFNTSPEGAEITITDSLGSVVQKGKTPLNLRLKSGAGFFTPAHYDMEVKLAGYTTARGRVDAEINGWYFGNLFIGGMLGMLIIDPATGAMWKLPPQYCLNLEKTAANPSERTFQIVSLSSVPTDLRSKLIPVSQPQGATGTH
jgi:hypothetical protein